MSTNYRRTFPSDLDEGGPLGDYIRSRELVDPDEDEIIARVAAAFVNDTRRLPAHAGKDDPSFHEPHWGHSTGLLRGTLDIDAVDALAERSRVGLFAGDASYPLVCRPNFVKDRKLRLAAGRIAIKLAYPEPVPNVDAPSGDPDFSMEVLEVRDLGDSGIVALRVRGQGLDSGVPFEETMWAAGEWRDGKMTRWRNFGSEAEALEAFELRG